MPLAAAVTAVVLRLLAQIAFGFYEHPTGFEEDALARSIVEGRGYVIELNGAPTYALRAPAYAFILAAIYAVFGVGSVPVGIAQALLGAPLAVLACAVGRRLGPPPVGLLAGVGAAADPALLVYGARIHPINLDAVLFLAGILLVLRMRDGPSRWVDSVLLGVVAGLDVLSRPTFLPALLLATLVAAWLRSRAYSRSAAVVPALVTLLATIAVVAPWSVRNLVVLGTPALTSSTGLILWIGNNPVASGGTVTSEGVSILDAAPQVREEIWTRNEFDQDAIFTREAMAYIASDPGRTARAYLGKLVAFWWFSPQTGVFYPPSWLPIAMMFQVLLLATTAIGLGLLAQRRRWWPLWVVTSTAVLAAASQAIFYVDGRHRFAIEPLLIIAAVFGVVTITSKVHREATSITSRS